MADRELIAAARECELQIKQIVTDLYNERNFLREEIESLRGNRTRGESVSFGSTFNDFADCESISDLKKMLKELYPIRLSDEEMLKLATLTKLQSEIKERSQVNNGKYKKQISFV